MATPSSQLVVPRLVHLNDLLPVPPDGNINVSWLTAIGHPTAVSAHAPAGIGQGGVNIQTGTAYTLTNADRGKIVVFTNPAAVAVTAPTGGVTSPFACTVLFVGAAGGTVTPTSGTLNGLTALTYAQYGGSILVTDGVNWWAEGTDTTVVPKITIITFPALTAGANTVPHGLGVTPIAVILQTTNPSFVVWQNTPSPPWDGTNLYVTASDPSATGFAVAWSK